MGTARPRPPPAHDGSRRGGRSTRGAHQTAHPHQPVPGGGAPTAAGVPATEPRVPQDERHDDAELLRLEQVHLLQRQGPADQELHEGQQQQPQPAQVCPRGARAAGRGGVQLRPAAHQVPHPGGLPTVAFPQGVGAVRVPPVPLGRVHVFPLPAGLPQR